MLASGLKYELDTLANKDFRSKRKIGWISAWYGASTLEGFVPDVDATITPLAAPSAGIRVADLPP